MRRVLDWLTENDARRWWVICLFLAALAMRLHWNLELHPIGEYLYSDMRGYDSRATALVEAPWKDREYWAFYPYGTTYLLAGTKALFGTDNYVAIGAVYALLGACIVPLVYAISARLEGPRWVAPTAGIVTLFYYPIISVGGYTLSELPFAFFLCVSVWFLLRLIDHGRFVDAWLLGLAVGLGATVRPQLLVAAALIGLYWLVFRRYMPRWTWRHLAVMAIPIALVLGYSSYRVHYHTERFGLISDNGTLNLVFGRCHDKGIYSRPDGRGHGTVRFAPPPLIQLERYEKDHPDSWIRLSPVWGDPELPPPEGVDGFIVDGFGCRKRKCRIDGSELEYKGYIGDKRTQAKIVKACLRHAGVKKQAYFSLVHLVQLWAYNVMWPDHANPRPRSSVDHERWRPLQEKWARYHRRLLLPGAMLGLGLAFVPRQPKRAAVALCLWSLLIVAAIWLGGIRFRVPYDPIIIILAMQAYGLVAAAIWRRFLRVRTDKT